MTKIIWVIQQVTYSAPKDDLGLTLRITDRNLQCVVRVANFMGFHKKLSHAEEVCGKLNENLQDLGAEYFTAPLTPDVEAVAKDLLLQGVVSSVTYYVPLPVYKMKAA